MTRTRPSGRASSSAPAARPSRPASTRSPRTVCGRPSELRRALGDPDAIAGAHRSARRGPGHHVPARSCAGAARARRRRAAWAPEGAGTVPGGVALLAQLSRAYFLHEEHRGRSRSRIERSTPVSGSISRPIVSDALITRGSALCNLGRSYEGVGAIRAGIDLADERGLVSTALRGRLKNSGGLAPAELGHLGRGIPPTEAALRSRGRLGLR